MNIGISGWSSRIAIEFRRTISGAKYVRVDWQRPDLVSAGSTHYLLCHGLLYNKPRNEQTNTEHAKSIFGNCFSHVEMCDRILSENDRARICVIGSESAYRGSYDESYAQNKALLHEYVQSKRIGPEQQLFCISPGIIEDAGMTLRRDDKENLDIKRDSHPRGSFLMACEVANMAAYVLTEQPYITGTVIRMHGSNE